MSSVRFLQIPLELPIEQDLQHPGGWEIPISLIYLIVKSSSNKNCGR